MSEQARIKAGKTARRHAPRQKRNAPVRQDLNHGSLRQQSSGQWTPVNPRTIVDLQAMIGNAAVQRLIQTRQLAPPHLQRTPPAPAPAATTAAPTRPKPVWAADSRQTRTIQRYLRRLGLYRYRVDGDYGPYTDSAMVEAYGGDSFRKLDYVTTLAGVKGAKPLTGKRYHKMLRYGEMFRDGVLDITVGVGHDEKGGDIRKLAGIHEFLEGKGFSKDDAKAKKLYKQAGRPFAKGVSYIHWVKERALLYAPPVGTPRPIHIVIRLISNPLDTDAAHAAKSYREGLARSDITYYTGHGRYGSGVDFDRNFKSFTLFDRHGKMEMLYVDYKRLKKALKKEGKRYGRSAWGQFLWRAKRGRIKVKLSNIGNIYLNPKNRHRWEFGARLIYWALKKGGKIPATGAGGVLAGDIKKGGDQRYRVVVMAGCRTKDYHSSLRGTPGLGKKTTHLLETTRTIKTADAADIFAAFMTGILNQFSANEIVKKMDLSQDIKLASMQMKYDWYRRRHLRGTFRSRGTVYDPRVR